MLGAVSEVSAGIVVVGRTVMVVKGAVGVLGGSVVFVGVKVGDIVTCDDEIGIIVTAIVYGLRSCDYWRCIVVVRSAAWLRAGAVLLNTIVELDRGAVVIWNAVVVATVGVFVPGTEAEF